MKLLRLAPGNTKISFMRFRRVSYPLSAVLSIIAVVLFFGVGMNFGIDFAGGTQVELRALSGKADLASLRAKADSLGLGPVEAQRIGAESDVTLRVQVQAFWLHGAKESHEIRFSSATIQEPRAGVAAGRRNEASCTPPLGSHAENESNPARSKVRWLIPCTFWKRAFVPLL